MKGIELAEKYFEVHGRPMLHHYFSDYEDRIAVGLVGQGSECFGFDDAVSRDHDFEPGFCLWLTDSDDAEIGFKLMDAYAQLPKEFAGISLRNKSAGAGNRRGVFTISEFYRELIGLSRPPQNWQEWFYLPEHALATAVNGKVFCDKLGTFSETRTILQSGFPKDIFLKKLAGHLALMAQAGQYNYERCLQHGEVGASYLALAEFVNHAFHVLFLLNGSYTPFYKWRFRALGEQVILCNLGTCFEELLRNHDPAGNKRLIEKTCSRIAAELHRRSLTFTSDSYLEHHAIELMKQIVEPEIRRLHLMETGE